MISDTLQELTGSLARSFAFVGIGVARDDSHDVVDCFAPAIDPGLAVQRLFRAASISKIVTGQTFAAVARRAGHSPPFAIPAQDILGWPLIHPSGVAITIGQLASHSAGLTDTAGYAVPPDQTLADWVAAKGHAIFTPHPPGTYMTYCNLGYLLLAACTEALGDDRFDWLARRHVLGPLNIGGGFNWSGVTGKDRATALPTYRRDGQAFVAQIDHKIAPSGVVDALGQAVDLGHYVPGQYPGVFSPQGGLRLSLGGMLALARAIPQMDQTVLWDQRAGPGDYLDGLMQDYGLGLQILRTAPFYPRPLIGHFANAYGFKGGVWYDAQAETAFAYALNGAAMGDDADTLSDAEHRIFYNLSELD